MEIKYTSTIKSVNFMMAALLLVSFPIISVAKPFTVKMSYRPQV
jgi:hypothetical protein